MQSTASNRYFRFIPFTGLLLYAAWPTSPLTPFIFFAWVPLLWQEAKENSGSRFFFIAWLNMLVWNAATTWWIWNSTGPGAVGAILANSLLMCFPLMAFRFTKKWAGQTIGYLSLPVYWLTFEYIHHNWDLSWPWLTLGNVFSTQPQWVRWYAYTGTTGGSLWIWLINIFLLFAEFNVKAKGFWTRWNIATLVALVLPVSITLLMKPAPVKPEGKTAVIVQPNVEAYTEKFTLPPEQLVDQLIRLSEGNMDSSTRVVVWPETAIPVQAWEHSLAENPVYQPVYDFVQRHPQMLLVTGIDSYKIIEDENRKGHSIRTMDNGMRYEAYNSALGVTIATPLQLYHKSKLVPGVETLPSWLLFMSGLFDDFGGTSGTLGRSDTAVVLRSADGTVRAAPVICYESIYSNYVTDYVRSGANVIAVITNDGWWGNTPGHKQHMHMARLRAIENNRWVVRSANTGISCVIDPDGNLLDTRAWETEGAIAAPIQLNNNLTFYSRYGDWLSRLLWPTSILLLVYSLFLRYRR